MVRSAAIRRKNSLLVRLVNHAVLLHEAAGRAHQSAFMRLHDQAVGFATVLTLVLLDIFLRFRQFVLLGLDLAIELLRPLLFVLFPVLLGEERIHSHVILPTLLVCCRILLPIGLARALVKAFRIRHHGLLGT